MTIHFQWKFQKNKKERSRNKIQKTSAAAEEKGQEYIIA